MIRTLVTILVLCAITEAPAYGEDVSGEIKNPNQQYGTGVNFRLVGETSFGWLVGQFTDDLDLNGHDFTMDMPTNVSRRQFGSQHFGKWHTPRRHRSSRGPHETV